MTRLKFIDSDRVKTRARCREDDWAAFVYFLTEHEMVVTTKTGNHFWVTNVLEAGSYVLSILSVNVLETGI